MASRVSKKALLSEVLNGLGVLNRFGNRDAIELVKASLLRNVRDVGDVGTVPKVVSIAIGTVAPKDSSCAVFLIAFFLAGFVIAFLVYTVLR